MPSTRRWNLGIEPRLKYRPIFTDYTGADGQDETYKITHEEFVRFAGFYGVAVEVSSIQPRNNTHTTLSAKKWTDEFKAEVRAYRDKHGLKKTAEHFGVSQATISKHLPAGKPKPKPLHGWPPGAKR